MEHKTPQIIAQDRVAFTVPSVRLYLEPAV